MKPVSLGIVGCGDIARFTALFGRISRRVRLAAACDIDQGRATNFARRYRIPQVCSDYAGLLQSEVEAVYLAVPHHLHFSMVSQAVAAGKAVFVEKPVTRTAAEGIELAGLVEKAGAKVAVNYQYRYDRAGYALARAVQQGALGRVDLVRINVPWRREAGYFDGAAWHRQIATAGGGTLLTQGSHFLDLAIWALGGRALSAAGYTARRKFTMVEVEDVALGMLEMDSGALIQIASSMAAEREGAVSIEVYGAGGQAVYSDRPWPRLQIAATGEVARQRPPVWGLHALQRSLEAFAIWVQGGAPHLVPIQESLPALAAVEAIYESARSGQRVAVYEQMAV